MSYQPSVTSTVVLDHLDATQVDQITQLLNNATEFDGVRPISEHAWLHLRSGESGLHREHNHCSKNLAMKERDHGKNPHKDLDLASAF